MTAGALVAYWVVTSATSPKRDPGATRALALAVDVAYAESPLSTYYGACVLASNEGSYDRAVASGEAMLQAARASSRGDVVGTVRAHYGLCHAARRSARRRTGPVARARGNGRGARETMVNAKLNHPSGWPGHSLVPGRVHTGHGHPGQQNERRPPRRKDCALHLPSAGKRLGSRPEHPTSTGHLYWPRAR